MEKSVLLHEQMFDEPNISLAICGKNISRWQMDMLIYFLGIEELTIGFDKEYVNYTDAFYYVERVKEQIQYLLNFMKINVLIDNKNVFKQKEAPVDRTKRDFLSLNKWEV